MDLLGDKNQDMMLEQALKFVEAKEAGKRSASRLLPPQATDAVAAAHTGGRRNRQLEPHRQRTKIPAHTVGPRGMEKNPPTRVRRAECPAFGTKCNYCGRDHHFEQVCRRKTGAKSTRSTSLMGRRHIRHTMPGHVNRQHQAHHPGPPCLQSSHKGMAKEMVQTSTRRVCYVSCGEALPELIL